MAQAGIHGIVGVVVKRWTPARKWLMLGIVLGNIFPDLDNIVVALATVTGGSTEGLHRTFTHSIFTIAALVLIFYFVAALTKRSEWSNLGWGLGIGVLMHIVLDLVIWFNGVEILWPLPSWVNFWEGIAPPEWWMTLMQPVEFLFLGLFFIYLFRVAEKNGTDLGFLGRLRIWTWVQMGLFALFTVLFFTVSSGIMTPFGALYLLSIGLAFYISIKMRETIEAI